MITTLQKELFTTTIIRNKNYIRFRWFRGLVFILLLVVSTPMIYAFIITPSSQLWEAIKSYEFLQQYLIY